MSDEPSDDGPPWWTPPGGPAPEDPDVLRDLARRIDPVHPIGPMSLRFRTRRPYVLTAVAVTALLCGAGADLVVTGSGGPVSAAPVSAADPAGSPGASGGNPGTPRPAAPARPSLPSVLHGQYVVRNPAGGYQTIDLQTGQVTAVSAASVTLRSADGFTLRYIVSRSTVIDSGHDKIAAVKPGDQVSVQATVSGDTVTATAIDDLTVLQHNGSALDRGRGTASGAGTG